MAYETKDARDILDPNDPFGGFAKIQYNSNTKGLTEWLTLAGQHDGFEALAYIRTAIRAITRTAMTTKLLARQMAAKTDLAK